MVNFYKILIISDAFLYPNESVKNDCFNLFGYIKNLTDEYSLRVCGWNINRSVYTRLPYIRTNKTRKILKLWYS